MKILLVTNRIKTYPLMYRIILDTLHELGHDVVWAADFSGFIGDIKQIPCNVENIPIYSFPFKYTNIRAYRRILDIIDEYHIEGVMCNTPIGSTLGRLAAKKKKISPVVYTAHGFLFYKGAPFLNRTLYKWVEVLLAPYTDTLITISEEDYIAAQTLKLRNNQKPFYVHGAGIKLGVNVNVDHVAKRQELGIPSDAFLVISAGDLNKNKNTEVMVKALANLKGFNVHYIACGVGPEEEKLKILANKLEVSDNFYMLGYRTDIPELLAISDAFVMMSFREGLPRSLMEAMDMGLPCIGSDTRGVRDLIDDGLGGYICSPHSPREFSDAILQLKNSPHLARQFGEYNKSKVKPYSCDMVKAELWTIYQAAFQMNNDNLKI